MRITVKLAAEIERRKLIKRMRCKLKHNNWRKLKAYGSTKQCGV